MACWDGTIRNQLFIHTEETTNNGQTCSPGVDNPHCWEGTSDYYSNGCIKLARSPGGPDDMSAVHSTWANWDGRHNFNDTNMLYVYGG